ncbi:chorismate mutase [Halobacillus shinanisalinarum]|uniref:chorismate mutase n=1 Tax=Halobacillus shinanisalinarum TaxID=2932258 RepID=A0ABY4GZP3_9BACI|nr:chorismate mutase [Halobacillus shinanisalinarum]UOQ93578.1 chorismate mutase [Halobacillus shinanisalinarum]
MIRGVRGATTVDKNDGEAIIEKAHELMLAVIKQNDIKAENVTSVFFTVTADLDGAFPAKSLRKLEGWTHVPVMCMQEIPVPNSLARCIRVMVTVETSRVQEQIQHVYHYNAKQLRPDLRS